ncbi:MAG: hypothetical protein ABGX16_11595 [Pirellulales bacterium]
MTQSQLVKRAAKRREFGQLVKQAMARFVDRPMSNRPKLLQENRKLSLWNGGKYLIRGLSLAPGKTSGHNVCHYMGACFASCIGYFNGWQNMGSTRAAEIARTRYAMEYPQDFRAQLDRELGLLCASANRKDLIPLVRPNVFSDVNFAIPDFDNHTPDELSTLITDWQDCQFFDYTKHLDRIRYWLKNGLPSNYHVTLSHSENLPWQTASAWLSRGHNISVVYDALYNSRLGRYGDLPTSHRYAGQWRDVVNGDVHDMRIPQYDGNGNLVGLRFKSNGQSAEKSHPKSAFYVRLTTDSDLFRYGGQS